MKTFLSLLWSIFSIIAVGGTYYGTWEHNWIIILVSAIPQILNLGYSLAKRNSK